MKNIFKFLMMGLMMIAFASATVPSAFAQPTEAETIYTKFTSNYKGPEEEKFKTAIAAGEEFIQKFGTEADYKAQTDFINKVLPKLKEIVGTGAVLDRFNKAVPAKNWDEAFAGGKEILAKTPDNIDVILVLASIGFDNAAANPPVDKYNTDAVNFAKTAIQKLEEGKPSGTGNFGAYAYEYKNKDFADGKSNALGWMNYTIGYIMFNRLNQKKEALPYLYKASQANSATKDFPEIYRLIGTYYRDEYNRIVADRAAKIKANEDKETEETRAALGMQYAYAERAIDAYARAFKVAGTKEKEEYKKPLMDTAKQFYTARFNKEEGSDTFIAAVSGKPFPDPTSAVTPVAVESITPDTPTTTGTPTTGTPTTGSPTTTPTTTPKTSPTTSPTTTPKASPTTTPKTTPSTSPSPAAPKPSPSATPTPKKPNN